MQTLTKTNSILGLHGGLFLKPQVKPVIDQAVKMDIATHHQIWIDCSGSMARALQFIKTHLKNKISNLVKPADIVSIGWFSGRGQFGYLKEQVKVNDLTGLKDLHDAIDRFLRPVGLTGFKEPVQSAISLIDKSPKEFANSFFFITDGYDNEWNRTEILQVCDQLRDRLDSASVVEFGMYCDHDFLVKMAEKLNGNHIFSENFDAYVPVIEKSLSKSITGNKYKMVLDNEPLYDLVWAVNTNKEIVTYNIENEQDGINYITVAADVDTVYYFTEDSSLQGVNPFTCGLEDIRPLYCGMGLLSQRMKSNDVLKILRTMGDVEFINTFNNSFGKQNLIGFQERCFDIALDRGDLSSLPFQQGRNTDLVPPDNVFCLIDLFGVLSQPGNKFYSGHTEFNYNRIGAKTVQTNTILSEEEQARLDEIINLLETETDPDKSKQLSDELLDLRKNKRALTFTKNDPNMGYDLDKLVWNKNRANLSIQVMYTGTVLLPANNFNLPENFPTMTFKTYTIIKDGVLNVKVLPVSLTPAAFATLKLEGLINESIVYNPDHIYLLDLTKTPTINRAMVKELSAKETFNQVLELLNLQAQQKVFKELQENFAPKEKSAGITALYGVDAANWLSDIGITDGGFNPQSKKVKSGEVYPAVELNFKVAGGTIGKVSEMLEKYNAKGKLNLTNTMMCDAYKKYETFIKTNSENGNIDINLVKEYITTATNEVIGKTRALNNALAKAKFTVIVGNVWFNDMQADSMEIDSQYGKIKVTAESKNVTVEV